MLTVDERVALRERVGAEVWEAISVLRRTERQYGGSEKLSAGARAILVSRAVAAEDALLLAIDRLREGGNG